MPCAGRARPAGELLVETSSAIPGATGSGEPAALNRASGIAANFGEYVRLLQRRRSR
jgi:hypothetical protein